MKKKAEATKSHESGGKVGRPSVFKPEFCLQATKLCRLGATDKELADFFEVAEATITTWKKSHPEFLVSIKEGKALSDAEVADKLFKRATGYEAPEDKVFVSNGETIIVPTTKHYPPDATSAIFWLKNRRPDLWRDKVDAPSTTETEEIIRVNKDTINAD